MGRVPQILVLAGCSKRGTGYQKFIARGCESREGGGLGGRGWGGGGVGGVFVLVGSLGGQWPCDEVNMVWEKLHTCPALAKPPMSLPVLGTKRKMEKSPKSTQKESG